MNGSWLETGLNRTGIQSSPVQGPMTIEGAAEGGATAAGDGAGLLSERRFYLEAAEPIGKIPPVMTFKGVAGAALEAIQGVRANLLVDRLGERLAFERAATRFYELLAVKALSFPTWEGGPGPADLAEIQRDEIAHHGLLIAALEQLGADPTAVTPSADVTLVIGRGIGQVLADPRTDLKQGLSAILAAELLDRTGWELLVPLVREAGQDDLAREFREALRTEESHLARVRGWTRAALEDALRVH